MKRTFLLLTLFILSANSAIDECKIDVYFGNGILTTKEEAISNAGILADAIKQKLGLKYYQKHIGEVDYAYNSTHGMLWDLIESAAQK